jgi:SPP1 gp7 family putative phage head morphogenesis protein
MGVVVAYTSLLRRWLARYQARIETILLDGWEHNPAIKQDASQFSKRRLGAVNLLIEETFNPQALAGEIRTLASRINKKGLLEFKRVAGVSLRSEKGIPAAIEKFQTRNIDLVKSLAEDQKGKLTDLLTQAEQGAWQVKELRKELQKTFSVSKSRADLIARDQVLKLNGQLNQMRQTNAGIVEYYWRSSQDERVREEHVELDGTRQRWDDPPIVSKDGDRAHPGDFFQCRCTAEPILTLLEE